MRRTFPIFFFLSVLLVALSCKKEELPGSGGNVGTPEFSLDNMVDGVSSSIAAGMEDYYMFTEYELGERAVYQFSGTLKKENCEVDCGSQLQVIFKDFQPMEDGNGVNDFKLEQALRCGHYNFTDITLPFIGNTNYRVEASGNSNISGDLKFTWIYQDDFIKEEIKNIKDPILYYNFSGETDVVPQRDKILGMKVEDENGNMAYREHKNFILRNYDLCYADIKATKLSNGKVELEALHEGGTEPFNFTWSTGEDTKTIEVEAKDTEYELEIIGSRGCTNRIRKSIKVNGNNIEQINSLITWKESDTNNRWEGLTSFSQFGLQLGTVILKYTDDENNTYSSVRSPIS